MPNVLTTQASTARLLRAVVALMVLSLSCVASAQLSPHHVVKVTVTGGKGEGQSATGFLWQSERRVVTSLHAVLRSNQPGMTVKVFCRGFPTVARVSKVLREADLALLTTDKPVKGCRVFDDRFEGMDATAMKPAPRTPLFTHGWKGAASSSTDRDLHKANVGGPETLQGLISDPQTRDIIRSLGLPALNLPIYFVAGDGLGGGYSGAPVVDRQGRLVAIVDGGLDKGMSDYNWVVPATFLNQLAASRDNSVPRVDLTKLDSHFSAGLVESAQAQGEVNFAPRPGAGRAGSRYHFVKTKSRSLAELAATADDPAGIRQLVRAYGAVVGSNVEHRLRFDIFEDATQNLIIAVPAGQPLMDGPVEGYPDIHSLRAGSNETGGGYIQFREWAPDAQGYQEVATGADGKYYYPGDVGYFNAYVYETLQDCRASGEHTCTLDQSARRAVRYDANRKILSFGIFINSTPPETPYYDYRNLVVRGNVVFEAYSRIAVWRGEAGLFQCKFHNICNDVPTALQQLSHLVAAQLTTFGD